jgi:hypothetical protein
MGSDPRIEITADVVRNTTRLTASKSIEKALFKAGILISAQIKINLRNQDMVETRKLINSIKFRVDKSGDEMSLVVGSFDNAYAHINEFGSNNITDQSRRAMFAQLRRDSIPKKPGKGVIVGSTFNQRPFIRPALDGHSKQTMAFLRDAIREFDLIERFGG